MSINKCNCFKNLNDNFSMGWVCPTHEVIKKMPFEINDQWESALKSIAKSLAAKNPLLDELEFTDL